MAHFLHPLFEPESIAVFGASDRPDSVGGRVLRNLREGGFAGPVLAINPRRSEVAGQPAHPDLKAAGRSVDLAVIATPAATVAGVLEACGQAGVKAAIVLSAGFAEAGDVGRRNEQAAVETARRHGIRMLGPNCLGLVRPAASMNATFSTETARPGRIALVSQSGAICTAIMDWAAANNVGFSAVVSTGSGADVDFGDVLDFLATDPQTDSILLYVEGVRDARQFMSGLRASARAKPVIVLKAGRRPAGERAAASHTGALVGSDLVFDAALRRSGVVRGMRIEDLFAAATTMASPFRAHGDRLAIVTNGGGPGAMASDRAEDKGLPLATFSPRTQDRLAACLPDHGSAANPVDVLGDAGPERYTEAVTACLDDPRVDGVVALLTPQAMTDPTGVARGLVEAAVRQRKPVLTCWMGGEQVGEARQIFREAGIPTFQAPEAAVEAFSYLARYHHNQQLLLQTPGPLSERRQPDVEGARLIIEGVLSEGRDQLSGPEAKAVLRAFGIPTGPSVVVRSAAEALVQAESVGFPVVLKVVSPDIVHKSDVGGVRLGIETAAEVRTAYLGLLETVKARAPDARIEGVAVEPMWRRRHGRELLVGIAQDPVFGPAVTFGAGGTSVEVMGDAAVALPPLNEFLIGDLISRTRVCKTLGPFRGHPAADRRALDAVLTRVSEIACELPWVRELDINPLILDESGAMAVDARIRVGRHPHPPDTYAHMAIHPYPSQARVEWQTVDGVPITIRPIRPEDAVIEAAFVKGLSAQAKFFRFMQALEELTPAMLARFTQIDYHREMALIATVPAGDGEEEIAVARYVTNPDGESCEFAIVVGDAWQGKGIGHRLMQELMKWARNRGLRRMEGNVLADNQSMLALVRDLGFTLHGVPGDASIRCATVEL